MGNAYRSVLAIKPTGDAVPANVLAGKTFSNADGTGKTGTMANNGAVSITLTDQNPTYTIPEGYHNGSGVVGFSASGGDGADLIVTCDSVFAGSVITCTDGTDTFTKTCPSSSPYEVTFQSIPVGTWTISGSYSGTTFSTIFTVLDFETALNAIPEGSTVTPTDEIQTWLHCANIWDKTYTTISQILSDASTLQALIASNNAADYMARSATWSTDVTADSGAMSYIGLNDYCADSLLADSTWLSDICNSTYFESVLDVKVPSMTSNTTPSGSVTGSGNNTKQWQAFDGNDSTSWNASSKTGWVSYDFTRNVNIRKVSVRPIIENDQASIKGFKIQGSVDGNNYTDLGDFQHGNNQNKENFVILNNNYYRYIKFITTSDNPWSGGSLYIATLQFYGRASS